MPLAGNLFVHGFQFVAEAFVGFGTAGKTHHAERRRAMGFCLFNNVAVAAAALRDQGERVLIVDYDADGRAVGIEMLHLSKRAPNADVQRQLGELIRQLDIRRRQVLVEAIIAEVSATKASELGLDYAGYSPNTGAVTGILNQSTQGALSNLASAASSAGTAVATGVFGASGPSDPRYADLGDELPRTETGKLARRAVRAPFWAGRTRRI